MDLYDLVWCAAVIFGLWYAVFEAIRGPKLTSKDEAVKRLKERLR